jgi:hypothetical protein
MAFFVFGDSSFMASIVSNRRPFKDFSPPEVESGRKVSRLVNLEVAGPHCYCFLTETSEQGANCEQVHNHKFPCHTFHAQYI